MLIVSITQMYIDLDLTICVSSVNLYYQKELLTLTVLVTTIDALRHFETG